VLALEIEKPANRLASIIFQDFLDALLFVSNTFEAEPFAATLSALAHELGHLIMHRSVMPK